LKKVNLKALVVYIELPLNQVHWWYFVYVALELEGSSYIDPYISVLSD